MNHKKIAISHILKSAAIIAKRDGFNNMTRDAIAKKAGVSTGTVSQSFGTMIKLKRSVMRYAIDHEMLDIIAVGLGVKDKTAIKASDNLKQRALATLL